MLGMVHSQTADFRSSELVAERFSGDRMVRHSMSFPWHLTGSMMIGQALIEFSFYMILCCLKSPLPLDP